MRMSVKHKRSYMYITSGPGVYLKCMLDKTKEKDYCILTTELEVEALPGDRKFNRYHVHFKFKSVTCK